MSPIWRVCCEGELCHITTEFGCTGLNGEWHPEWTTCEPDPCDVPPVPTDPESWGAIKSVYR